MRGCCCHQTTDAVAAIKRQTLLLPSNDRRCCCHQTTDAVAAITRQTIEAAEEEEGNLDSQWPGREPWRRRISRPLYDGFSRGLSQAQSGHALPCKG